MLELRRDEEGAAARGGVPVGEGVKEGMGEGVTIGLGVGVAVSVAGGVTIRTNF